MKERSSSLFGSSLIALGLAAAFLATSSPLHAAVSTWSGGATGNGWGSSSNWSGAVVPTFDNTTDLNFDTLTRGTNFIATNVTVRSMSFGADIDSGFTVRYLGFPSPSFAQTAYVLTMGAGSNSATITVDSDAMGNITLGADTADTNNAGSLSLTTNLNVVHNGAGLLLFNRPISGPGASITKTGSGTMQVNNTTTNTGAFNINGGTLIANAASTNGFDLDNASAINFGNGTLQIRANGGNKAYTNAAVNVNAASRLVWNNTATNASNFNLTISGTNAFALNANLAVQNASSNTVLTNQILISRNITGSGNLTNEGYNNISSPTNNYARGRLTLSGTNTNWNGNLVIAKGTVSFGAAGSNAVGNGTIILGTTGDSFGAGLGGFVGTNVVPANTTITFTNPIIVRSGGFRSINIGSDQRFNFTGDVTLEGTLNVNSGTFFNDRTFTFAGNISGVGGLDLTRGFGGAIQLLGSNSCSGPTTISNGADVLAQSVSSNAIGDLSAVTISGFATATNFSGGTNSRLRIATSETIGSLAGPTANADLVISTDAVLTTGGNNASTTYAGNITGAGGLTKEGTGTMTIAGPSTYTGNTVINNGRLELATNGSLWFVIGGAGTNNSVSGAGTAIFRGTFNIDLTTASTNGGDSWTLVSGAGKTYDGTFQVAGFTNSSGTWTFETNGVTYVFQQATGQLFIPLGDQEPPTIALVGANPLSVFRGSAFVDPGATVTDNIDAPRTIYGSGTVNTAVVGTYTLTYSASDSTGNLATPLTRTVDVVLNPVGDEDGDGLTNAQEEALGTNVYQRDTDGDGVSDYREVAEGTNPLNPADFKPLSKGLVAYYPLDGDATDQSGHGNHATNFGAVFSADRFGDAAKAVSFNGASYLVASNAVSLPVGSASRTLSCWARGVRAFETVDGTGDHVAGWGTTGPARGFGLMQYSGDNWWGYSWGFDLDSGVAVDAEWKHLVLTYDGAVMRIFVNGRLRGTRTVALNTLGDDFYMGVRNDLLGHFAGDLDDVRVYNRALNTAETLALYAHEAYADFGLEGAATKAPFDPATAASWSAGGTPWTIDTSVSHDGRDSVKAQTADNQSTYRQYTVSGPAVVDFWWKVSSEQGFDFFSYAVDGVALESISGEVGWSYRTLALGPGTHTIRWTYSKDGNSANGADAGYLDDFAVLPAFADLEVRDGAVVLSGTPAVDFGGAVLDSNALVKVLTFSNKGTLPLEVDLELPSGSPFTFAGGESTYPLVLARGESVNIGLRLSTATAGAQTATLAITAADSVTGPPQVTLTGTILGGKIALSRAGNPIASGQSAPVPTGIAPSEVIFAIGNTGHAALTLGTVTVSGPFQITQQPAASIGLGATTTFKVRSLDTTRGAQSGVVTIPSGDPDTPAFTFAVSSEVLLGAGGGFFAIGSVGVGGSSGAAGWSLTGVDLKSGITPHSAESWLRGTVMQPGLLQWAWKTDTQQNFDWLVCEVNGKEVAGISMKSGDWQSQVVEVPANAEVRWIYRKDAANVSGDDEGRVGVVSFIPFASRQASYAEWSADHGDLPADGRLPGSGLPAVFAWQGAFDPATGPAAGYYMAVKEGAVTVYRFPISKTASGLTRLEFSTDLCNWNGRVMEQSIVGEDAERFIIEAAAPGRARGFFRVVCPEAPTDMALIPGGIFAVGDPSIGVTQTVSVSAFYMAKYEVTKALWNEVASWAAANGYDINAASASGKASNHPAYDVNWYEAVKWCNARSQKEGLTPCYTVAGATYKTGNNNSVACNFSANGYRLPMEAEWEKAARGGLGELFPWGDTITQGHANYFSSSTYSYDVSPTRGYHPNYDDGTQPFTSPVGSFAANTYGLFDVAGNVFEWCWNWYSSYTSDPLGPSSGSYRIFRGGSWSTGASSARTFHRDFYDPGLNSAALGFRCVRSSVP